MRQVGVKKGDSVKAAVKTPAFFKMSPESDRYGQLALELLGSLKGVDFSALKSVLDSGEKRAAAINAIDDIGDKVKAVLEKTDAAPEDLRGIVSGIGMMLREFGKRSTEGDVCNSVSAALSKIGDRKSLRVLVEHGEGHSSSKAMAKSAALALAEELPQIIEDKDVASLKTIAFYKTSVAQRCDICREVGMELESKPFTAIEALEKLSGELSPGIKMERKVMGFLACHSTSEGVRKEMINRLEDGQTLMYVSKNSSYADSRELALHRLRSIVSTEAIGQLEKLMNSTS